MANFRKATTLDKAFADGYVNLGIALAVEKKFADASAAFRNGAQLHPRDAHVLARWADALERQGQRPQALDKPRQAQGDVAGAIDGDDKAIGTDARVAAALKAQVDGGSVCSGPPAARRGQGATR